MEKQRRIFIIIGALIIAIITIGLVSCTKDEIVYDNSFDYDEEEVEVKTTLEMFKDKILTLDDSLQQSRYGLACHLGQTGIMESYSLYFENEDFDDEYVVLLFMYDKETKGYKKAEKNQFVICENNNYDNYYWEEKAFVKNGYAIWIKMDYNNYDEVLNLFNNTDLEYDEKNNGYAERQR